jgi:hypothetical protein
VEMKNEVMIKDIISYGIFFKYRKVSFKTSYFMFTAPNGGTPTMPCLEG